ncbi:hypothetical protein [Phytohabitans kaempferiae]|uniref:Uncharacterized protein n=1 Tax=Phytohabitans kaempferiae TaxID=1620943 RepID=A0ABV6M1I6_9ACTN
MTDPLEPEEVTGQGKGVSSDPNGKGVSSTTQGKGVSSTTQGKGVSVPPADDDE